MAGIRGILRTELSPRFLAILAAFIVGTAIGSLHELALRGWQRWAKGGSDVEAQLTRPELLSFDLTFHVVDLLQHARHRGPAFAAPLSPGVQAVALTTEPGLDDTAELVAVVASLDAM